MAIIGTLRPPLQPGETFPISAYFSGRLDPGETIQTALATSKNEVTGADTTATFCSGTPSIYGSTVSQTVHNGVDGDKHLVKFVANTSFGKALIDIVRVPVVA